MVFSFSLWNKKVLEQNCWTKDYNFSHSALKHKFTYEDTKLLFTKSATTEATILISPIDFEKYDIGEGLLHNGTKNFMEWNYTFYPCLPAVTDTCE